MPKVAIFLAIILFSSPFLSSYGFLGGDLPQSNPFYQQTSDIKHSTNIVQIPVDQQNIQNNLKRYLIFGSGSFDDRTSNANTIYSINSNNGFFSVGILPENKIYALESKGYHVVEDVLLDFHSTQTTDASRIGEILGSSIVHENFNYNGSGITIAIVDTGVDFSNPDVSHSLARDKNNHPIMLDADGQGIILTNATFAANIDEYGVLRNFTKYSMPENVTSTVYKTKKGVFLDIVQDGNGTIIQIYNSFFPLIGSSPIFNGTLASDMKIGHNNREYIVSQSKIYHLGVMYQGDFSKVQVVPVLVVDSKTAGVYDTIIPDMSTSWKDYTRFDLPYEKPDYDFDFTDERHITLGSGNEFLTYDSNDDGQLDYSAGTIGARVVDLYGVIGDKAAVDKKFRAINGSLLTPMDPNGEFFGVMTDFLGHGTSSAASITSQGLQEYDIYNNTEKYIIKGVAPGAKIVPIKALWFGDSIYAWLWAAGLENEENTWKYKGSPKVDIISNSWGISTFPTLESAPGLDVLSLILSVLTVPKSIDANYPGVTIVSSAGNSGHGYGTIGLPGASPYGITVGATTNNVFVGYGPFQDQPRFGNTTEHANHVVDFSSRGPGVIGDPKPDLMSIGAYSFTPTIVTKPEKESDKEAFTLFGGTSMAAPLVSGSAALIMQSLNEKFEDYDPFRIKNILMSTATDLRNDPFTQGSGLVNVTNAIKFVNGDDGMFIVYNDKSVTNVKNVIEPPLNSLNIKNIGIDRFEIDEKKLTSTNWFGGRLLPGERSSTTFTIENPSEITLDIKIKPQTLRLIEKSFINGTTEVHQQDKILNQSGTYAPNYIRLSDIKEHDDLLSFYDYNNPIPDDASLLILNVNFPFGTFMNKTNEIYANDLQISSLYLYDWIDKNNDTEIVSSELSMVNRGGSWGTVQEIRITEPNEKFDSIPIVGIYPVPTKYSFWIGDTKINSTSMDYILTSSYYKKDKWDTIWTNNNIIQIPPKSSAEITATIVVPNNYQSGIYQGFLTFEGEKHTANVPVSFAVAKKVDQKDSLVMISGTQTDDILYGNGYVKGAFDMVNRYMSGDWRQYYFEIDDKTINTVALDISWQNDDTNLSVFVIDPQGKIAQTNVPSGVFGHFLSWPSLDWLGTSPFSQGGGFFPVKNKDDTSTVLFAPINQTGTYSVLVHSTLFNGNFTTEPITIAAKFSTIIYDDKEPEIIVYIPEFISSSFEIKPEIKDENLDYTQYFLDEKEFEFNSTNPINSKLSEGKHELKIFATDILGQNSTKIVTFTIDNTAPSLEIKYPKNLTTTSGVLNISFDISDANLPDTKVNAVLLPTGEIITDETTIEFDASTLEDGQYEILISAKDLAKNSVTKVILFILDHSAKTDPIIIEPDPIIIEPDPIIIEPEQIEDENSFLIVIIGIGIAIGIGSFILISKKIPISQEQ